MLKVLSCLTTEHDWRLVLVAVFICAAACVTSFRLYGRVGSAVGGARISWIAYTGFTAGAGVWATHFISMLAYQPHFRTGYQPAGTAVSLAIAIVTAAIGFGVADLGRRRRRRPILLSGGVIIAAGIALMHYTGMAAFRTEGHILWSQSLVIASAIAPCLLVPLALNSAGSAASLRSQLIGAGVLVLAIASLHFTGMGAVTIVPDPTVVVPPRMMSDAVLAGIVTALVGLILMAGFGVVIIEAATRRSGMDRLNHAIEAVGEGLAFYDRDDRLLVWNAKYFEFTPECHDLARAGTPFRNILQRGLDTGCYPEAVGREAEWLEERIKARRSGQRVLVQRTSGDRWLRIEERPTGEGVVSALVDVTELKRDAEALSRARDAADAANRAKSVFLSNMSHELRTPLNGISGFAHALSAAPLEPAHAAMVDQIRASALVLDKLVADLLDLARVETGKLEVKRRRFHVGDAVRAGAELAQTQARAKGVDLVTAIAAEAEAWVEGDDVKLTQILGALLSNAAKFTDAGSIELSVARKGPGSFEFAVADTGVGFDPAQAERLFQKFEQSDGALTRRHGGGGIGLSIARELARALGGDLDAQSVPGHGSTFRLTLPLETRLQVVAEEPEAAALRLRGGPERPRALIVDDHPLNRQVLELMLKPSALDTASAENGLQACELYEAQGFDLMLMDMQMPVMDGLNAVRRIRAFEAETGRPPAAIVMVTANALPEDRDASLAAGADAHVAKPVNPATLFAAIERAFEPKRGRAAA